MAVLSFHQLRLAGAAFSQTIRAARTMTDSAAAVSESAKSSEWPWKKAKKVVMMLSFSGKNYLGMQRNIGLPTIEGEIWKALLKSGSVPQEWFDNPQKAFFQRASRTDKGVSAMRMVISLKMLFDETDSSKTVEQVNRHLPEAVKVHDIKRVTKNFNSKSNCDSRTYRYLMPSYALRNVTELQKPLTEEEADKMTEEERSEYDRRRAESFEEHERYRVTEDVVQRANDILAKFVGSHFFHNYTSGKLPLEPSSLRFITKFGIVDTLSPQPQPLEMVMIEVRGQSFMLHQIRKMIGLMLSVIRGSCGEEKLDEAWGTQRVGIPRAPGLGLVLDQVHYDSYNKRYGNDGIHEKLEWKGCEEAVAKFTNNNLYSDIVDVEWNHKNMLNWLQTLQIHSFSVRHFENVANDVDRRRDDLKRQRNVQKVERDQSPDRKKAKV